MQNIHKEIEEKPDSNQYRRRHDYSHIETVIDGVTYKILSVSPSADEKSHKKCRNCSLILLTADKIIKKFSGLSSRIVIYCSCILFGLKIYRL